MGILSTFVDLLTSDGQEIVQDDEDPSQLSRLEGPFLSEQQAIKDIARYKDCLCKTYYAINCLISRHILVLCDDQSFDTRDDLRLELGIQPHNHQIGIHIDKDTKQFDVFEIDRNILLNPMDRMKIKLSIAKCPPTDIEVKNFVRT